MTLRSQNILFIVRAPQHGGTENVVLQLCEIFCPLVNRIVVASAGGFDTDVLKRLGIKHFVIPDIEDKSPQTILIVAKKIKQIVKEEHITVIHTHHRMAAFYVRILGLNKDCYFINTSHNTFKNRRTLTRFAYKKANLIACGTIVKNNLVTYYGLDNVAVIHNAVKPFLKEIGVDEQLKKDKESGRFLIGNIGRLSEQKGIEYFIRAIPKVLNKHPKTNFYIIGSGEDEIKLKRMSKDLPVYFMGYRKDIQNLMSQLDLIVLSSLWEGFPLIPIEAFSVGKTLVATGVDGTLEIVKDGKNGLLVDAKDVDGLANSINWMIDHPNEKKQMEKNAKEDYTTGFSFDAFAKAYLDYYGSL